MTPDPLAAASIFLAGLEGRHVGMLPDFAPPSGPPGVRIALLVEGDYLSAALTPDDARRLALALNAAADALRAAYHAWEQEQSGVATPPLPFEYPEVKE